MSPGWARTRGDALGQHGKVRRCRLEPNVEQGKARWHQQGHEAWQLGHHRERRCWKRRERGKRAETFPGSTGSTLGRSSAVPGGLWTTQLGHSSVPSLVPPACQGTRVTQRVTQPPQPQPATKLSFQSGFRLTRAPKSLYREGPVPRSRLGTPAAPAGPAAVPAAVSGCPCPAHLLKHPASLPACRCCQNCGSAAPKREEEALAGHRAQVVPPSPFTHPGGHKGGTWSRFPLAFQVGTAGKVLRGDTKGRQSPRAEPSITPQKAPLIRASQHRNFITWGQFQAGFSSCLSNTRPGQHSTGRSRSAPV